MDRTLRAPRVGHARSADRPSAPAGPGAFTLTVGVIVAMVVAGGGLFAFMVDQRQRDQRASAIERMSDRAAAQIEELIVRTESRLAAAAGIVGMDGTVTPVQFNAFADGLATVPSIVASTLSVVVDEQDRDAFEAERGVEILERVGADTFRRASDRQVYVPIAAVAPDTSERNRLLGLDLLDERQPATAIRRAWNTGRPEVSEPLALVSGATGFLVVQPLFEHGADIESETERRERVVGFISVAYDAESLAGELAARVGTPVARIEINGHRVYDDDDVGDSTHSITAVALGTTWNVLFVPDVPEPSWRPFGIVFASLVTAALLIELVRRSRRYERGLEHWAGAVARQERRTEALRRLTAEIASADDVSTVASRALEHGLEVAQATWGRIVIRQHEGVPRTVVEVGDAAPDGGAPAGASVERLRSGGDDLGSLTLSPPTDALGREGRSMREMFIGLTAAAVARTRQRQSDHELAKTLQAMLLPRLPTHLDGVSLCGVYLPRAAAVGGDWYDAFATDVGFKFVVGDIVGKGARAAGAMGNLRIATHMVSNHRLPETVLDAFDAVAADTDDVYFATAAVIVVDSQEDVIRSSLAGHPPPLMVRPSGEVMWLDGGKGLPLGVNGPGARHHETKSGIGPLRLVLYTDGLVERRGEALSDGLARLADSAVRHRFLSLGDFCAAVTADLLLPGSRRTDDVAVLAIDLPGA